jgi:hypothetical protein
MCVKDGLAYVKVLLECKGWIEFKGRDAGHHGYIDAAG